MLGSLLPFKVYSLIKGFWSLWARSWVELRILRCYFTEQRFVRLNVFPVALPSTQPPKPQRAKKRRKIRKWALGYILLQVHILGCYWKYIYVPSLVCFWFYFELKVMAKSCMA